MTAQTGCCEGAFSTPDPHFLREILGGQALNGRPDSHAHQPQPTDKVLTLQAVANSLESHQAPRLEGTRAAASARGLPSLVRGTFM